MEQMFKILLLFRMSDESVGFEQSVSQLVIKSRELLLKNEFINDIHGGRKKSKSTTADTALKIRFDCLKPAVAKSSRKAFS
ncbi:hypothetical protein BpHYR1_038355 [Brachionus plicatilis]|uniref:Uncharacterized protein n=1 Tax=Brachionus plicatilis TaxID=10195 RepID=A0A3M7RDN3_BRAPC|nr:hypothetical protein BpHYR1_038355 [Brachionus plicatilis]